MTEVLELDPRALKSHALNLREKVTADPSLVQSIRTFGIVEPLVVTFDTEQGTQAGYTIVAGHRRAAAAIKAKLATVPCVVRERTDEDKGDVGAMFTENVERADLNEMEQLRGLRQMALFGVAIGELAKRSGRDEAEITAAIAVLEQPKTTAIATKHNLTIPQAIALADFEDDTEALKELTVIALQQPGQLAHSIERRRTEKARAIAADAEIVKLQRQGVSLLAERPDTYSAKAKAENLTNLNGADGKGITPSRHKKCPGHVAVVKPAQYYGETKPAVTFFCLDWRANGHKSKYSIGPKADTELTPEQLEERKAERQRASDFGAATKVRRQFLGEIIAGRLDTAGEDAVWTLLARRVAGGSMSITTQAETTLFASLTGIEAPGRQVWAWKGVEQVLDQDPSRKANVMLALIAAEQDVRLKHDSHDLQVGPWYELLRSLGYEPAPVEDLVITAAAAYAEKVRLEDIEDLDTDPDPESDESDDE